MKVFFSYTVEDEHIAKEICGKLRSYGINPQMTPASIPLGSRWPTNIVDQLKECEAMIVLITPRSRHSSWVQVECGIAWALEKKVFPLLQFIADTEIPKIILDAQAQYMKVETIGQVDEAVAQIVTALMGPKAVKSRMTWQDLEIRLYEGVQQMEPAGEHPFEPNLVIGVGKRGAICAAVLAKKLRANLKVVEIIERNKSGYILDMSTLIEPDIKDKKVLIVEYVRFTGAAIKILKEYIGNKLHPDDIQCFAVGYLEDCLKSGLPKPEYGGGLIEIVPKFPWAI